MNKNNTIEEIISNIQQNKPFIINYGLTRYLITATNSFTKDLLNEITDKIETNLVLCTSFEIATDIFMSGYSSDYENLPLLFSKSFNNKEKLDKLNIELNVISDFINKKSTNLTDVDIDKIVISKTNYTNKNQVFKMISLFLEKTFKIKFFLCSQIIWDIDINYPQISSDTIHKWLIKNQKALFLNSINLPSDYGKFYLHTFTEEYTQKYHILISVEDSQKLNNLDKPINVRVHSKCVTGDIFASNRCDCGHQLIKALKFINEQKTGMLLYLNQEGRGIGFVDKMKAYLLQEQGYDTVEANLKLNHLPDERDYSIATKILEHFNIKSINLITNNPDKVEKLRKNNINIVDRIPSITKYNKYNEKYMKTKVEKMNHLLDLKK